jgi:hypothetical protein
VKSIKFPLEIINGDIATDDTPADIIISEIKAILSTRLGERVYRQDYGTNNFLLKKLNIGSIIAELSLALENNLAPLGFSQIILEVDSPIEKIQKGAINVILNFSVNEELFNFSYTIQL